MTKEELFLTIKYMKKNKYFKCKEEYLKTKKFANEKNIPNWLVKDIDEYYQQWKKESR